MVLQLTRQSCSQIYPPHFGQAVTDGLLVVARTIDSNKLGN